MNIANEVFDTEFVSVMPELAAELSGGIADIPDRGKQWVFYGSQPLGATRPDSDVDALLLHDIGGIPPHRRGMTWQGVPVTIYVITRDDLAQDGLSRRFGGYFALKLFSPFIATQPEYANTFTRATAQFLGPFSYALAEHWNNDRWTASQIIAHAHLAFIDLYPGAASYFARILRNFELLNRVWRYQTTVHVEALRSAGQITSARDGLWRYTGNTAVADLARERARCIARFWAFGAICHDSDLGFPDLYFDKADARVPHHEQDEAQLFLQDVVHGRELP